MVLSPKRPTILPMFEAFLFILVILAVVAFVIFFRAQKASAKAGKGPKTEPELTIENLRVGGVVQLQGVGDDLEDFDVVVKARHTYDEDGFRWYELEGEKGTEPVWIEIERDDELEVSICLKKLKLSDLQVTGTEVEAIGQRDEGEIEYDGATFLYEDCGKARFFRNSDRSGPGERFQYWDFETKDGQRYLSIERWGEKEYLAYLSEPLRSGQIKVFSLSS
jgi:hypothetical protein